MVFNLVCCDKGLIMRQKRKNAWKLSQWHEKSGPFGVKDPLSEV